MRPRWLVGFRKAFLAYSSAIRIRLSDFAFRHPGDDRSGDLIFPAGDCSREGEQFGDAVVAGAPAAGLEQPVTDVPLARGQSR